jgi:hypothetical protein
MLSSYPQRERACGILTEEEKEFAFVIDTEKESVDEAASRVKNRLVLE